MPLILILADDLSGAADCAGGCAAAGLDTRVLLAPAAAGTEAAVLAVDVDTREMAGDAAACAMGEAVRRIAGAGPRIVYQKMDSTLRGNWARELAAARQALGAMAGTAPLAVVAPAFPALGRTMRNGEVLVHGRPLAEVAGRTGDVAPALRAAGLAVRLVPGDDVRGPDGTLAARLRAAAADGIEAIVCDAEADQDLARIAEGGRAAEVPVLWAGSAGLMRELARGLGLPPAPAGRACGQPAPGAGPLLFVVGSAAPPAQAQLRRLVAGGDVEALPVAPGILRGGPERLQATARALDAALAAGRHVALSIAPEEGASEDAGLAAALGRLAAPRLARAGGLLATGGRTARSVLEAAGVAALRIGGEVEPGVPWGATLGAVAMPIATKAGGFGGEATLLACRDALEALRRGEMPGTPGAGADLPRRTAP